MSLGVGLDLRVQELRRAFDASFALPRERANLDVEDLLLISLFGDRYAVKLHEVNAIAQSPVIVAVPSSVPSLLGVAGVRGNIVPVFRLAGLLGYGSSSETLSWVILCGGQDAIAFAFDGFEGFARAERSSLRAREQAHERGYLDECFASGSGPRPIVAVTQLVAAVRLRSEKGREKEER